MTYSTPFKRIILPLTLSLISAQSLAAGFQLNAQSATGLGRAFAGDAVIADNASVMARNVAAMALFDKTALSLGVNFLDTDITVSNATYTSFSETSSDYENAGDLSVAPNIHLIVPINKKFSVGINLYSNFATKTEFDDSFVASEYGGLTDVKSLNLGLATAYRINQQWSIGAGLDIVYGTGELKREASDSFATILSLYGRDEQLLEVDAAGFGIGFNLGTVFELNKNNRFGLSYHYSPEIEAKGDISYGGVTVEDDTLYLPLPDMLEFSGYHRINESKFALHYSIQWIEWSTFETLDSEAFGTLNNYQWKDAMHFSLGGTYYLNDQWTLRTGYMYDQSAQDEITSISVPDSDRQWFSAGFTYHLSSESNIDLGATYLLGKDVLVEESNGITSVTGTTRANAILFALQYSRTF